MSVCENIDGQCGASWCNCDEKRKANAHSPATHGWRTNQRQTNMKTGIELIRDERGRQMIPKSAGGEGWTAEHDDEHVRGEMAHAAGYYAKLAGAQSSHKLEVEPMEMDVPPGWPWHEGWWKPSNDKIRNLVKAGALIAAEIDRLQRKASAESANAEVRDPAT